MNTRNNQSGGILVVLTVIVVVAIAGALGWVAYSQFTDKDSSSSDKKGVSRKHPEPASKSETSSEYDMSIKTPLKTKEQGDCTLTMKDQSGKVVLTEKTSTKDKKGQTGCGTWHLLTKDLKSGTYAVEVVFQNDGYKEVVNTELKLEK